MKAPKISVVMSVYNGEEYLERAVRSVLAQSERDFELLAVNDCSTDESGNILDRLAREDERIRVLHNETNLRLPASLNRAIGEARGEFIARMDADDLCLPERFERQLAFFAEHPETDLVSCRFMTLKNGKVRSGGCGGRNDTDAIATLLLFTNPILHPGVMAKASVMKENPYDTTLTCTEDLELWTRLTAKGCRCAVQREYLMLYRLHDKQITATTKDRQKKEVLRIAREYFRHYGFEEELFDGDFFIPSVYFRDELSPDGLRRYFARLLRENKKRKLFSKDVLSYAMLEIALEYKRLGISKLDLISILSVFSPAFLYRELRRRRRFASEDGEDCIRRAESLSLSLVGNNREFPEFSGTVE